MLRAWLVVGLVSGCGAAAKRAPSSASYAVDGYGGNPNMAGGATNENTYFLDEEAAMPAPPPPPPPPSQAAPGAPPMERSVDGVADARRETTGAEAPTDASPEEPDDTPARMVFYDGWAQIRTPRSEELIDTVVALVEDNDGYVESRGLARVSARVPVAAFDTVWDEVLALGPVVRRHLGADDVTDAFTDLSLRLASMEATRKRLTELLARATEERDKLELIQQIHRLTEQLEVTQARVKTLRNLAALSRITVEAVAPALHGNVAAELPAGMGWIDRLTAWSTDLYDATARPVRLDTPEGFVRLDKRVYRLRSADGATLHALTLRNDPQGDADFWRQAVVDRIGDQLDDGALRSVGGWQLVRFVEQGATEPYVWHLGFRVDGKHLQLLQLTYPTEVVEARYHQGVLSVLGGGAS